jgi:RNA polymerase sigma-70 factor (ECF subfamily)
VQPELAVTGRRDREADFDDLIGPHLDAGYRTALAILRNPDEAHDAVQEAALKAWKRMGSLRDEASARSWFLAIVANQCRSERRRHRWSVIRQAEVESDAKPAGEVVSADSLDIDRELAKVPREDRLALFLYFYLDLPMEEVGHVLGVSAAGAKTRVYRAAKKLRPGLEMS